MSLATDAVRCASADCESYHVVAEGMGEINDADRRLLYIPLRCCDCGYRWKQTIRQPSVPLPLPEVTTT